MSSRDYLKHFVDRSSARATNPGDEYWDPVNNKLYKTVLTNGTTTTKTEVALGGSSPTFSTLTSLVKTSLIGDVNVSSGTGVTAIIRLNAAALGYTGIPSIVISAPTSANGVQATAVVGTMAVQSGSTSTVVNGGSGYTLNDTITVVGGTGTAAQFTVSSVSGGVVTAVTRSNSSFGQYSILPVSPVSVTGGTGTGCTINVLYEFLSATVTNPGSGYVEQPAVTFSGGGGTGALAYASVGSGAIIRSLGTTMSLNTSAGEVLRMDSVGFSTLTDYVLTRGGSVVGGAYLGVGGSTTNASLYISSKNTGFVQFFTNNWTNEQFRVTHTASAVNYVQATGSATGVNTGVQVQAAGTDAAIPIRISAKGGSSIIFSNNGSTTTFVIENTSSSVNYFTATGGVTGSPASIRTTGTDTNISMLLQTAGTGAIDLAAGSSGVNISNGGTVTAITRTAFGSGYTTIPSVAITAPTTAGGVQAISAASMSNSSAVTITNGGTGYTANDVLTVVGGTGTAIQITVSTVSAGVITAASITAVGFYSVLPTNPVSVTGGTGSSATFTLGTWYLGGVSITNAGSGYVEQPTVTFSGGGGSGAAAYATVGSGTVVKSVGSTMSLYTSGGEQVRVNDSSGTANRYIQLQGGVSGSSSPSIGTAGGGTTLNVYSSGGSAIDFWTNGSVNTRALTLSHTASAVNYVQVTGAATTASPTISLQGSDTNIGGVISTKGTGGLSFYTNNSSQRQLRIIHTASAVNFLDITGSATGAAPSIAVSASSTDTNIDLTLTPKGTGSVIATAPVKLQGYTVATLPTAGVAGRFAYVTDATAPTYRGTLTGGGAAVTLVFDTGAAWISH